MNDKYILNAFSSSFERKNLSTILCYYNYCVFIRAEKEQINVITYCFNVLVKPIDATVNKLPRKPIMDQKMN